MKKVFTYSVFILFVTNYCFSQSNDYFEKISIKFNDKNNSLASVNRINKPLIFKDNSSVYKENLELPALTLSVNENSSSKKNLKNRSFISLNDDKLNPKLPIWIPISEVIGLNLGLGAFNTYVGKSEFAKISFKTIQKNFQTGSVWDTDFFITNFFAHPYHGNLYFNTARSSGYSFYESAPFALGGSLMWEIFMENEPPSLNDLINTTISGIFLGEVLYRLSSLVIDERQTGFKRVMSEIGAGLLNPFRAFNRLITKRSWKVVQQEAYEVEPLDFSLSYGVSRTNDGTQFFTGLANGILKFDMVYGNPFKEQKRNPFDFFRIRSNFNFGAGQPPIGTVTGYGIIAGQNFSVKNQKMLAGAFQHYDFFDNNIFEVAGISFGAGLMSYFPSKNKDQSIVTSVHLNLMPLGASNSAYSSFGLKTYNYSVGANMKFESLLDFSWGDALINYNLYFLHTVIGEESNELVGILKPRLNVDVYKNLSIGTEFVFYHREGYYADYPDVHINNNETSLFVTYQFKNIHNLLR
ncbi:MAG: DUF3943 domain-containing protein [Ignavibacteria bacterium]|nr:DUF3943 domain-containing protein [Ignavibacteria bacterium]